jgi:RHS repeat-associated protein
VLLSNKHFTPVIGLDIHIVVILGFPVPLPHPYIGFVLDPMDYIPFLGASTKINHVPRGKSDTSGIIVILFHIPMGGPFLLAPMIGHDSVNFFGSQKVKVEGNLMSPAGHMLMTCNDIGLPLSFHPGKKFKPIPSMYLPTSFSIPISFGQPVNVGGPFVPDWAGVLLNIIMSYGFGALLKGLGHAASKLKKVITKFNLGRKAEMGTNKLSNVLCKLGFEPVDLIQGIVIYNGCDFELPGPLPLKWERSWYSDSRHDGLLGHGVHLCYDMRIAEYPEHDAAVVLLADGRSVVFPGAQGFDRSEQLTLTKIDIDTYQLFDHRERLYYYFERSRLVRIENEAGFEIKLFYNGNGYLQSIHDSVGRVLTMQLTAAGRINKVTVTHKGESRLLIGYNYNTDGDLCEIIDALGQPTYISYTHHKMMKKTDRNGHTFYWEYDQQGRCIHTWGDDGTLEGFIDYYPEAGYNVVTNGLGQSTTYYYTPDFLVTQVRDPMGNSRFTEFTDYFEIYREIDEEGNMLGFEYDEKGNRTAVVQPDGSEWRFNYDINDRVILATNPQGGSRVYIYYPTGLLHTITEADGRITVFRYNSENLLNVIDDNEQQRTTLEYDGDYNLCRIALPSGATSSWDYDPWGRCVKDAEQHFIYDELSRLTQIRLADGNMIQVFYDAYQHVTAVNDKHHSIRYDYTSLGDVKLREEHGSKVHYTYDKEGLLTGMVNEHGENYRILRDGRGRVIEDIGFDGQVRRYNRDATGKVVRASRPGNIQSEFEYDVNGNLVRAEHSDGTWETFSYNRNGQLIETANQHSTVRFQRDVMGRIITEWQDGHTVSSEYAGGNRRAVKSSLGADIQLGRNNVGDVTDMYIDGLWHTHFERDPLGAEIERLLPGHVASSWSHDHSNRLATHNIDTSQGRQRSRTYRWDTNQQLKEIINNLTGTHVKFNHDDRSGLVWAQYENGQTDYRIADKVGEIYRTPAANERKYGSAGKLLTSDKADYVYDDEGNLIRKVAAKHETWEYEWNANGTLKSVKRPDGKLVSFRYDALGRRIEKAFNGKVTRFLWDRNVLLHEWTYAEQDRPVIHVDELGAVQQTHAEPLPSDTLVTWIFEDDKYIPVGKIQNGQYFSILTDHIGAPCEAYNTSGEMVWRCEYDIYGKIRKFDGDRMMVPFRYQGQYEDAETGLYYNRFRYYNPEEGLYISQDPIGIAGDNATLYAYVKDPNIWVDVWGLDCVRVVNGVEIHGKGQSTGPGHAQLSEILANKLAMTGKFKEIHLNRSYQAVTGVKTTPRRSPDLTAIDHAGKVHAIEIASRTDMGAKYPELTTRNQAAMSQLPANTQGDVVVLDHPYDAANIKSTIDNWVSGL